MLVVPSYDKKVQNKYDPPEKDADRQATGRQAAHRRTQGVRLTDYRMQQGMENQGCIKGLTEVCGLQTLGRMKAKPGAAYRP